MAHEIAHEREVAGMAGKLELPFFHFRPHPRWRGLGSLQVSITERYVPPRVWHATEVLRVAHASRVLAMTSRHRGLSGKACFGVTPKPTRETRALPRRICGGRL